MTKKVIDSQEKQSKPKRSKDKKGKRLDIATKAIIDNVTFSKDERWAYYRLSNTVFDFLSIDAKISITNQIINAFANLMNDRQEPLECQLIVSSNPVDIDAWEEQIRKVSEGWSKSPGFDRYISEQAEMLRQEQYFSKVTYLGINIGKRGELGVNAASFIEAGISGGMNVLKRWLNQALQLPGEEISEEEEKETREREEQFYRTLSTGNLRAERCTAEELLLLIKRQFYPSMSAPYLDVDHGNRIGSGDLALELSSAISRGLWSLNIKQMIDGHVYEGYRAALTFSRLPKEVNFPYSTFPFMYFMNKLGLPFTCYARFSLHPTAKMKKELEKKKKEAKDEIENLNEAASSGKNIDSMTGTMPTEMADAIQDMQTITEMLAFDKNPWVEGVYRVVVETPTEKQLKDFCSTVIQRYSDLDINVSWTVGDQAQLFLEQMPGDKIRGVAHKQLTDLTMFGTSGFMYASDVGDLVFEEERD